MLCGYRMLPAKSVFLLQAWCKGDLARWNFCKYDNFLQGNNHVVTTLQVHVAFANYMGDANWHPSKAQI